jgi:hypothetical protein
LVEPHKETSLAIEETLPELQPKKPHEKEPTSMDREQCAEMPSGMDGACLSIASWPEH